jgi:DNA polymerase I-like protein with 3'-5' exonuclease and polymerase domains
MSSEICKGYVGHVVNFWPILAKASERGLPVNQAKLASLEKDLLTERKAIYERIQSLIPLELKEKTPRRKDGSYGYKRTPKEVKDLYKLYKACRGREDLTRFYNSRGWYFFVDTSETNNRPKTVWFKVKDWVPSKKKLVEYINWKKQTNPNWGVPVDPDGKESTSKVLMEQLVEQTDDEVLKLVFGTKTVPGLRSIDKMITNDIANWKPSLDGRVHTQFGMTAASGQLDSRKPNILNASLHTNIGKIFRRVIEAPAGYILVECDKKSYHVATMGYCANDKDYIRFSQLDPHSYFLAYIAKGELGLPSFDMSDTEILEICARYKKDAKWGPIRQAAKAIVLGNQLGLGAKKAYILNKKLFSGVNDVAAKQRLIAELFPKVDKFKQDIKEQAHRQRMLINDWGYKQEFWEVFTWKYDSKSRNWVRVNGTQAEAAIAFPVQSTAFGELRDKLLQLEELGLNDEFGFVNSVHDSVMFCFEKAKLDQFLEKVLPVLVSPSRVLKKPCCPEGLQVGVEVKVGKNWAPYHHIDNPEGMRELRG